MKKVKLGDLEVSAVGLGCMGFTHAYGTAMDENEAIQALRAAVSDGYTLFDTAECYTGTKADGTTAYNEEVVGKALEPYRYDVIIATKFGVTFGTDGQGEPVMFVDSSRQKVRESVEGSLKKLRTDHIDLYYQHRIDPKTSPEEIAETMKELIAEGKIRVWGISEADAEYVRRADAVCHVSAVENQYSMLRREQEKIFPTLMELGIGFVAYSPMEKGFLSTKYNDSSAFGGSDDYRNMQLQYTKEGQEKNRPVVEYLQAVAREKNCTPAQLSLAWMMHKEMTIVPIPGSRNPGRIAENGASAQVVLSKEEVRAIDAALDQVAKEAVAGYAVNDIIVDKDK